MTEPVISRVWNRMRYVVSPGTGKHRIHSEFNALKAQHAAEHERIAELNEQVQILETMLANEMEANRRLHNQVPDAARALRDAEPPRTEPKHPHVTIPVTKVPVAESDVSTIPLPKVEGNGFVVRTLSGKPLLASIPQQPVRE